MTQKYTRDIEYVMWFIIRSTEGHPVVRRLALKELYRRLKKDGRI